jgi:hypothetical protein
MAAPAMAGVLQVERDAILREYTRTEIAQRRSACALAQAPALLAALKNAGLQRMTVGQWCVTVLTRAGRDGTLGHVRDPRSTHVTAAIAFDGGFVNGYFTREAVPPSAPAMATLLPIADRCLGQKEPNVKMCGSAGFVLGARAARGELVPIS